MIRRLPFFLASVTALSACGESSSSPPAPAPTETPQPSGATLRVTGCASVDQSPRTATVTGDFGKQIACHIDEEGAVQVEFEAPAGSKLTLGGQAYTVGPDGKVRAPIDLDGAYVGKNMSVLLGDRAIDDQTSPVKLEPPTGAAVEGKLEIVVSTTWLARNRTRELLTDVASGKTLPRPESGSPAPTVPGSLVYVPPEGNVVVAGPDVVLARLDLIAVGRDVGRRSADPCQYSSHEGRSTMPREDVDLEVTVYEASTAKQIGQKTFSKGHECPFVVTGKPDKVTSYPPYEPIAAWLKKQSGARR